LAVSVADPPSTAEEPDALAAALSSDGCRLWRCRWTSPTPGRSRMPGRRTSNGSGRGR